MKSIESPPNLQSVEKQFEQWRNQKTHRREAIPEELWNSVICLSSQYSRSQLSKILHLNSSVLKSKLENHHTISKPTDESFVEVRFDSIEESSGTCSRLEVERRDGSRMRFHFEDRSSVPICSLIQTFLS